MVNKIRYLFVLLLFFLLNPTLSSCQELEWTVKIKEGKSHAAFTSLEYYSGYFYCSFREAYFHVDKTGKDNGRITIMRSRDGKRWRPFTQISKSGFDLRDPKLSVTPDNKLMLITEAVKYVEGKDTERKTMVTFLNHSKFETLQEISFLPAKPYNWLWDVEWVNGNALGFLYNPGFLAVTSKDGISFDVQQEYKLDGFPTEAALTSVEDGQVVVVVRVNGKNSMIGFGDKSMKHLQWYDAGCRVEGPDIIRIKGKIYVCGRSFDNKVGVSLYLLDGYTYQLRKVMDLPANGDCSYPGMKFVKKRLYISFHSSDKNRTSVYLSRIKL